MILTLLLVSAAIALGVVLRMAISRTLVPSSQPFARIEPIDVDAFRNLVDPREEEHLRRTLPAAEFRRVQRQRLRAAIVYVQTASRNAAFLVSVGQAAIASNDNQTAEAARRMVDQALQLRHNAVVVLLRFNLALIWPSGGVMVTPVVDTYDRLTGSAMLLGRLQNPAAPIRISAS